MQKYAGIRNANWNNSRAKANSRLAELEEEKVELLTKIAKMDEEQDQ